MGRDTAEADGIERYIQQHGADKDVQQRMALSQEAQAEAQKQASAAAPHDVNDRIWYVTKEGVRNIPQGFVHSLDPKHILPNVAMGFAIGAGTKLLLPAGGPVAKVAGVAMAGWFIGKPVAESYYKGITADTMGQMDDAAKILGDTIGGMPVAMAEGAVGAKVGTMAVGRLLASPRAQGFVEWKGGIYDRLDARIDSGVASFQNFAYDRFGVGGPVMRASSRTGIVPPHLLEELVRRHPENPAYRETIKKTEAMSLRADRPTANQAAQVDHKGAREVYDAQGQETVGKKVRSEGEPPTRDPEVNQTYDYSGDVRSFYADIHKRNSIDGKGMKLESTVNYGQNFENAFWDGQRMTYGRPGPESPFRTFVERGVSGHEVTHGVTQHEAGTVYRNQPGALNEHFSDVWGVLIDQRARNQTAAEASWLVGEGIWKPTVQGKALRSMLEPGSAYNDKMIGKDPQPGHMKDYINTRRDNGGVHLNSGIPNRAFALFAREIGGYAWEGPAPHIWYEARAKAGSQPSFAQFAHHTIEAAKKLGFEAEVPRLQKAWSDVGITPSLLDNGMPTPPWISDQGQEIRKTTVPR